MDSPIHIAPLETIEQFKECERLQALIWESDSGETIPSHLLITFQRHGGLVLGAFDAMGQMIGLSVGFLGLTAPDHVLAGQTRWQHCSHELGVVRDWRGRGVGYQLKLAQRDWVIRQGLDLITWTYDPLETANASLNIGKLGAVCRCYLRDVYGTLPDGLNAGLPSDRFEVTWRITSARVTQRLSDEWHSPHLQTLVQGGTVVANPALVAKDQELGPGALQRLEADSILIEIPANFQALKKRDLGLAREWRAHSREAFETCFAAGYSVCDVVLAEVDAVRRAYYWLRRTDDL
jgi:predicted GNAT superfamily acetyltransferase